MPRIRVDFDCPECGAPCSEELEAPYPDFGADRASDRGVTETEYLSCDKCGQDIELEVFNDGLITVTLKDSDNAVTVEEFPEPEPPDDEPPNDVYQEFELSQWELLNLLGSTTDPFDGHHASPTAPLVRMVFSQLVAVLEAYLADRLHRAAIESPEVKLRLLGANVFKDKTIGLRESVADPGLAERTFVNTLKSVLYHDFKRVENLYKTAFRIAGVFPSPKTRTELDAAVTIRHDCVHRNGKDKEGDLRKISSEDVRKAAKAMREFVDHLEGEIAKCLETDSAESKAKSGAIPDGPAPG